MCIRCVGLKILEIRGGLRVPDSSAPLSVHTKHTPTGHSQPASRPVCTCARMQSLVLTHATSPEPASKPACAHMCCAVATAATACPPPPPSPLPHLQQVSCLQSSKLHICVFVVPHQAGVTHLNKAVRCVCVCVGGWLGVGGQGRAGQGQHSKGKPWTAQDVRT